MGGTFSTRTGAGWLLGAQEYSFFRTPALPSVLARRCSTPGPLATAARTEQMLLAKCRAATAPSNPWSPKSAPRTAWAHASARRPGQPWWFGGRFMAGAARPHRDSQAVLQEIPPPGGMLCVKPNKPGSIQPARENYSTSGSGVVAASFRGRSPWSTPSGLLRAAQLARFYCLQDAGFVNRHPG
ncbi:hypothetical protein CC78DRAFT_170050 [Lojkania enalia]|uniref:Uncharacterized protein n=1 Tax=Lojkania enalia TaxID=147567 RepID=A0A9P4N4N9_9PLEO|nr:hypothetical protein CC78DRAFT_170050 [Didymosphaeria enalia]